MTPSKFFAVFLVLPVGILTGIAVHSAREARAAERVEEIQPTAGAVLRELERLPGIRPGAHLSEVAEAVASVAAGDRETAADLIALGWHESNFRAEIGAGDRHGDHGRAFGYWQSWEPDRSGGVLGQARRAAAHLRLSRGYCDARGDRDRSARFALYATGKACRWAGAPERARRAVEIGGRL